MAQPYLSDDDYGARGDIFLYSVSDDDYGVGGEHFFFSTFSHFESLWHFSYV